MKKILAFLIALSLMINLFSFVAFAAEVSQTVSDVSFELLEALGIDKGINPDTSAPVTRAEFAAMAVRAVNMAHYESYDGSFTDVSANHPFVNEIYTAKNLKMTNGTSEGVFSPDDTVNCNVALKIMLTAMGYETMAVTYGGFPYGYAVIEAKLDITEGISGSDTLTVGDAKTIVTNALKEDMATFSAIENGDVVYNTQAGVNLLTEKFNLKKISGVVTKAGYLSVEEGFVNDETVTISDTSYKCKVSPQKYFGTLVYAWVNQKGNEIYAVESAGVSRTVSFDAENLVSHQNNALTVFEGEKTKSYKTAPGISFIENGRLISHSDSDFVFPEGKLTLIDTEGDGKYDYALAEKIEYFIITGINSVNQSIYDKNSSLGYVELEEDSEKHRLIVDEKGNELDFSSLQKDMVAEVMQSIDKKVTIVRVTDGKKLDAVVSEAATETILEGITEYTVTSLAVADGAEYHTNTYFKKAHLNLTPGESYTIYIAGDGRLTYAKRTGDGDIEYGFYLAFGRQQGLDAYSIIKILSASNTVETFELAEKITLDGTSGVSHTDSRIDTALINGEYYKYQLIRYSLDSEGRVNLIDTADGSLNESWERNENPDIENMLTQYLDYSSVNFRGGAYFGAPSFTFTKGVIFVAPTALHSTPNAAYPDEAFEVMDYTALENNINYNVDIYDFNEYYNPKAIVVYKDTTGGSVGKDTHFVYSVTDAATQDGDVTKLIRTYSKGRYFQYFVSPDELSTITLPKSGDVVRLALDYNNHVKKVTVDAEYDKVSNTVSILYSGDYTGYTSYISGRVKNIGDGTLVLRADNPPTTLSNTSNIAPLPLSSPSYAIYDVKTGTVTKAASGDILTEELVGQIESAYVVCRLQYYAVKDVIIYKK